MKYFKVIFLILCILNPLVLHSQNSKFPKLVVGIVVDQMRFDDLYRYYDYYSGKGFKRLIKEGLNFTNAHYNYIPTNTGPGHASIYTGSVPYYHGIVNNDFYDRNLKKTVNCVSDADVQPIGTDGSEGKKSPIKLSATTITDGLKLFTNKKSKVISISIKDRGAILPAGHMADGVFWYNPKNGDFITSSFYTNKLPEWVIKFNQKKLASKFLNQNWDLLQIKEIYSINNPDESNYEFDFFNEGKTSFPHSLKNVKDEEKYEKLAFTPFIHELLVELAKAAVVEEKLGQNAYPDFLAISFSSTDLIGHTWGNYSYELMDTYLRLDEQIASLLNFLDEKIGKENYLLFLTSDHGAIETPGYLQENKIPTGEIKTDRVTDSLYRFCQLKYGDKNIIEYSTSGSIYINHHLIKEKNFDYFQIEKEIAYYLRTTFPEIQRIALRSDLEKSYPIRENSDFILNGWNPSISGDIIYTLKPGYLYRFMSKGTTHGSPYTYDSHIPLVFFGWKIQPGTKGEKVYIVDIAPTIANLLKIKEPNACIGVPLIK